MIIYLITNKINGKRYVGQSIYTAEARWKRHCWRCTFESSPMPITKAIRKYGKENFSIKTLCHCSTQQELDEMEIFYAGKYNTFSPHGYNLKAGQGSGLVVSAQLKKIMKGKGKGRKVSQEVREKMSISHRGLCMPESTKIKLSSFYSGRPVSFLGPIFAAEKLAKSYIVTSPSGVVFSIHNLTKFCKEMGLSAPQMCSVSKGKYTNHKGWICRLGGSE